MASHDIFKGMDIMNKILIVLAAIAMLALPAGATAKPTDTDLRVAKQACKQERGKSGATRDAFKAKYHGFGRCVRGTAQDAVKTRAAHMNAAKECKAERMADPAAFAASYGTNANARNAFGKCVSSKTDAGEDEESSEADEDEDEDEGEESGS